MGPKTLGRRQNHQAKTIVTFNIDNVNKCLFYALFTTFFTIQFIVTTNGQQNPTIVHITPGQSVDLGDTVDLSCSVQYGANYPIIWTKLSDNPNNPPLFISKDAALTVYDNRYSIRHDDSSSTYTLQVSKVSKCSRHLALCANSSLMTTSSSSPGLTPPGATCCCLINLRL